MKARKFTSEEMRALQAQKVVKNNELILKTSFDLSARSQKVILFLISKIQPGDNDFQEYEFSIPDFCRACGIDAASGRNYEEVKAALLELKRAEIRYHGSEWVPLQDGSEALLSWIESPRVDRKDGGKIWIRFDKNMRPFLLHLKERFTQYELFWTLQFERRYSIRLYELAKAVHYNKLKPYDFKITPEDLRDRLGADKCQRWVDLKRRALDPAVQEVNDKSDMLLSYETITNPKTRAVKAIILHIETKDSVSMMKKRMEIESLYDLDQVSFYDT